MSRLVAGLAVLAKSAGADTNLDAPAVQFKTQAKRIKPTQLPTASGPHAALTWWGEPDGIQAMNLDRRGLSWLRLVSGKLDRYRLKRTSLMRQLMRSGERTYLIWAMPMERCLERDDRCSRRASGVAVLPDGAEETPPPRWLAGHPFGRPDRSMQVGSVPLRMLSLLGPDGGLRVGQFALPEQVPTPEDKPVPAAMRSTIPTEGLPVDGLLMDGPRVAYLTSDGSNTSGAVWLSEDGSTPILPSVAGAHGWLAHCATSGDTWIAYGTDRESRLARLRDGQLMTSEVVAMGGRGVIHAEDPDRDRVRLHCDQLGARLLLLDPNDQLRSADCDQGLICGTPVTVAEAVAHFDTLDLTGRTLISFSGTRDAAQVRLVHLSRQQPKAATPRSVAACWDRAGGLCGHTSIFDDGHRIVLGARSGGDLLAIESADGGDSWQPMGGLQVGTAIETSTAPLDQHRIRKGLD